jgi:glycine cleavage system H protein
MTVPNDLLYTEEHEWVRVEGDGTMFIGITDFAQEQLGDVVYVELPAEGTVLSKGDVFGQVESTKSVSDLYAPISGRIVDVNLQIERTPEMINADPYESGWLIRVKPENSGESEELLRPSEYEEIVAEADD